MDDDIYDPEGEVLAAMAVLRGIPGEAWTTGSVFELGMRLDRIRVLKGFLAEVESEVQRALAETMVESEVTLPGVGVMRRRETKSWTWRYDGANDQLREDLRERVAVMVAMDNATGEIDPMKRAVATAALNEAYEAIPSFSTLKRGGERRLRMHIEDYRSFTTRYAVDIEEQGL